MLRAVLISFLICLLATPTLAKKLDVSKVTKYSCGGTEPMWGLKISPKAGSFWSQEDVDKKHPLRVTSSMTPQGIGDGHIRVMRTVKKTDNTPATIVIQHSLTFCSDGMSDKDYRFDALVILPKQVFAGCCD
jgi:uncharacterized membrane protein